MRSCIYCGKELEKGEKCTCPRSTANQKQDNKNESSTNNTENTKYNNTERTQYKTGYTRKDSWFRRTAEKARARKAARGTRTYDKARLYGIADALRDPVDAVRNPKDFPMALMLALWAVSGALIWLCIFSVITNVPRGPFAILANLMAINGIEGYKTLAYMGMALLSGAVSGLVMFFAYTATFFLINRFVFRDKGTPYRSICQRLALTLLPFTVISVIGTLLSLISPLTLFILLICGAVSFMVLTYEALKTQWVYVEQSKVLYAMILGMFVLLSFISYIII